jgi:hypothetical protein
VCQIAVCKTRKLAKDEIESNWRRNDDGAGIAWANKGTVKVLKGIMKMSEFVDIYSRVSVFPHVVHFRLASSGGKNPLLTHPFIVSPDSPLELKAVIDKPVLFHNGTILRWDELLLQAVIAGKAQVPEGPISDSRVAAILASLYGVSILRLLSGKFAVLFPDGTVTTFGDFEEEKGILFSSSTSYYTRVYIPAGGRHGYGGGYGYGGYEGL